MSQQKHDVEDVVMCRLPLRRLAPRAASPCAQAIVSRAVAWLADRSHAPQQPVFALDVGAAQVEIHGPYQRP
jgi:hypothetical protein